MKVLLVNGSPHKKGSTYISLCEIQKTLKDEDIDSDIFWIGNKPIRGCINCGKCSETGLCNFKDVVYDCGKIIDDYDGFIFGSPVYYASPTGQIISFMDRLFYSAFVGGSDKFNYKPAASIAIARRAGTVSSIDVLNKYYALFYMPIITSHYWNDAFALTPDDVKKDLEGMQIMRSLARNLAFNIKAKKIAIENGLKLPTQEERVFTNFIGDE